MENLKERVISALNIQNSLLSVAVIYTIVSPTWQAISLTLILSSYNAFRCYLVMRDTQGIGRMLGTQLKAVQEEVIQLKNRETISKSNMAPIQGMPTRLF